MADHSYGVASSFVLLLAASTPLWAPPLTPANCTTGIAASISRVSDQQEAITLRAAPGSIAAGESFFVRDAMGRLLRNVEVEFTLSASHSGAAFGTGREQDGFVVSNEPHRVVVSTADDCWGTTPLLAAGQASTDMSARVIANPSVHMSIPISVMAAVSPRVKGPYAPRAFVGPGAELPYVPNASVWSFDGVTGVPYVAGVPVTFSVPASGPSAVFANGLRSTVVLTDPFGVARAPARAGSQPGEFEVRFRVAGDATEYTAAKYLVFDRSPQVNLSSPARITYGASAIASVSVLFRDFPCEYTWRGVLDTAMSITLNGSTLMADATPTFFCLSGELKAWVTAELGHLPFGTYELAGEYAGNSLVAPVRTPPATVTVAPAFEGATATGAGRLRLGLANPRNGGARGECTIANPRTAALGAQGYPATGPSGVSLPLGLISFEATQCNWRSTWEGLSPPIGPLVQQVLLEADSNLPEGTKAWAYGPTRADPTPHWYELATSVVDRLATFEIGDSGPGDDALSVDQSIRTIIGLGVPAYNIIPGNFQDLWWVGPQENGWGMTITQHRDMLFAILFVYDAQGEPRWLVMPGGQWNASKTAFTASVYRPRGAPYFSYDVSRFRIGNPVGTATLSFAHADSVRLQYTIDGIPGTHFLKRLRFPFDPWPAPRIDDLWWGGVQQDGWGVVLAQQYRTIFGLWFTYDAQGEAVWFAAPSGTSGSGSYRAPLYRPKGSPWLGRTYDPAVQSMTPVGSVEFSMFGPEWGSGRFRFQVDDRTVEAAVNRLPF